MPIRTLCLVDFGGAWSVTVRLQCPAQQLGGRVMALLLFGGHDPTRGDPCLEPVLGCNGLEQFR